MRTITLGTAGHIDHGKTALVRALTGQDTDRLPEEKRRGITIDLGFAHLDLDTHTRLVIIDVPGHEAFIRNMAAGASGIDLGLLVIAADEGVRPQTREHVAILESLAVAPAAIALTKVDRVDEEWLDLVEEEVRSRLTHTAFAHAPLVRVSGSTGYGIPELKEALAHAASNIAPRATGDFFRMPVDRVFTIRGTGTVVTGTVWSGTLARDEQVKLLPSGLVARVRGLERQGQPDHTVSAGQRAAVALSGLSPGAISRGETLVTAFEWPPALRVTARVDVHAESPRSLRNRQRVHLHLGTAVVTARLRLLGPEIDPGTAGFVVLQFENATVVRAGDRFVLRSYSPVTTIAGGQILEWSEAPYRRRPRDIPQLERLGGDANAAHDALLTLAGWRGVDQRLIGLHLPLAAQPPGGQANPAQGRLYHPELEHAVARALFQRLQELHEQYPMRVAADTEAVRQAGPPGAPAALRARILDRLIAEGRVLASATGVSLPGWTPHLSEHDSNAITAMLAHCDRAGIAPVPAAELLRDFGENGRETLRLLVSRAQLIPIGTELYMRPQALERARHIAVQQLGAGAHSAADFRVALGLSRKHLIPLLEHFDRVGLTRRSGDLRTLESIEVVSDLGGSTP